jgi:hypothetical protein
MVEMAQWLRKRLRRKRTMNRSGHGLAWDTLDSETRKLAMEMETAADPGRVYTPTYAG